MAVLDPVAHERIIKDMDHVVAVANIPKNFLDRSMLDTCGDQEVAWVRDFNRTRGEVAGLVLHNQSNADTRCMLIVAALVRNFVDARIVSLSTLLDSGDPPDPTVMVIPNFYQKSFGKTLPAWKVSHLHDVLISRFTASKPTVLVVEDFNALAMSYGQGTADFLQQHFVIAK